MKIIVCAKPILLLILLAVSFSTCKKVKNNEIDATIYVKQYGTNTPIANAEVLITRGKPGSGIGSTVVESIFTDANGKAIYDKTVDKNYMYYAEAYKDKYFNTHDQQVSLSRGEKNFETTIYMYAYSYVKLHVKNVSPFDQYDWISISTYCYNFYLQGMAIDTTFLYCDDQNEFMGDYHYNDAFYVKKNNITSTFNFSYTPTPFDTINVNINY